MRFTRALCTAGLLAAVALPLRLHAQVGIGGFVGREFDEASDWFLFGAHVTYALHDSPIVINPRLTYHSEGFGTSSVQLDLNVLYDFALAKPGLIRPYLGVGGGLAHLSTSSTYCAMDCSSSKLVGDFVAGFKLAIGSGDSRLVPFLNTEYSFAKQFTNTYQMTVGVTYTLKQ